MKTGLNWFVVDCDLDHSVFAFRIADIGGQNSDEIEACASLGMNQTMLVTKLLLTTLKSHCHQYYNEFESYEADIILICYSVTKPSSFRNIEKRFGKFIKKHQRTKNRLNSEKIRNFKF